MNSSPPYRPIWSPARRLFFSVCAVLCRAWSPIWCPQVSFIVLKLSMSIIPIVMGLCWRVFCCIFVCRFCSMLLRFCSPVRWSWVARWCSWRFVCVRCW